GGKPRPWEGGSARSGGGQVLHEVAVALPAVLGAPVPEREEREGRAGRPDLLAGDAGRTRHRPGPGQRDGRGRAGPAGGGGEVGAAGGERVEQGRERLGGGRRADEGGRVPQGRRVLRHVADGDRADLADAAPGTRGEVADRLGGAGAVADDEEPRGRAS